MGRLSNSLRRRRYRGRLVLWGGRRYDVQVGSERDRATVRIRAAVRYGRRYALRNPIAEMARVQSIHRYRAT